MINIQGAPKLLLRSSKVANSEPPFSGTNIRISDASADPAASAPVGRSNGVVDGSIAGKDEDDYAIDASYRPHLTGFVGVLKVVRLTDAHLLHPFDGADEIGSFATPAAARAATVQRGGDIVHGDLRTPEL
ncbi:hypothetical protein CBA19CS22_34550 [Caballeronia novacaledonica]|uniref:Uncharacterized protein n=1 Tax=Caballeronia novacaledonica TaxID=1544861 RepID=A0ACB5R2Z0_9BURK|nr:hypothetical protein CBA19CS22_34550 [Caballeronia novacaledonica]